MDPMHPTAASKPASEEIFGTKFCPTPCAPKFCPPPRDCWESIERYKPTYYEPWDQSACPSVKVKMLDEQSPVPNLAPKYCDQICKKLTRRRMTDEYTRCPPDPTMYCVSKYKTDYCRPLETHIIPHCPICTGRHVCQEHLPPLDLLKPPVQHRKPRFVWHDGFSSLNYSEKPFPVNPVVTMAERCNKPSDDLYDLPCLRRERPPLPPIVDTCMPIPGGDCAVLLKNEPFDPRSTYFGGPGDRTKRIRRLRQEAIGRILLSEKRQNPIPCGIPLPKKPWRCWSCYGGVYNPKRPPYTPVYFRAGASSGLPFAQPVDKTLDF